MLAEVYGAINSTLAQTLQAVRGTTKNGSLSVGDSQSRYQEMVLRGNAYMGGMGTTVISAATFSWSTTGATATPIAGIYNPLGSGVRSFISLATLAATMTALIATGGGPYVWMGTQAAGPISTGAAPFNLLTLLQAGTMTKNVAGVALTGMTGTLALLRGSSLSGGSATNISFTATAAGMQTQMLGSFEAIDGSLVVPPNAVVALMATTTPVAHAAASGLVWEDVAI